jgi:hypothetical protein
MLVDLSVSAGGTENERLDGIPKCYNSSSSPLGQGEDEGQGFRRASRRLPETTLTLPPLPSQGEATHKRAEYSNVLHVRRDN